MHQMRFEFNGIFAVCAGNDILICFDTHILNLVIKLNPFTLRVPLKSIICYFHTFKNNLGIKRNFIKYLKESCCMASDYHFSFKYFPKYVLVRKIFPKLSGLFWTL